MHSSENGVLLSFHEGESLAFGSLEHFCTNVYLVTGTGSIFTPTPRELETILSVETNEAKGRLNYVESCAHPPLIDYRDIFSNRYLLIHRKPI